MKDLKDIISEKLVINKDIKINKYHYHPTQWSELKELVKKLIKERGTEADLNDIDTSKITDMSYLFINTDFDGDISEWNVNNVENMNWMFSNSSFTGKNSNLNKWKVNNVKLMNGMFSYSKFKGNINDWNTPKDFKYNLIFKDSPLEKHPPKWYKK